MQIATQYLGIGNAKRTDKTRHPHAAAAAPTGNERHHAYRATLKPEANTNTR